MPRERGSARTGRPSSVGITVYLTVAIAAAVALTLWQNRSRDPVLRLDAPDERAFETLGLSEALR